MDIDGWFLLAATGLGGLMYATHTYLQLCAIRTQYECCAQVFVPVLREGLSLVRLDVLKHHMNHDEVMRRAMHD